ncbi:MAG TPA: hypothetical protein PKW35_25975, partial [Nannocystaceae bacterium]|nr:hypothetical protein [Nannocystaceae bacterium]
MSARTCDPSRRAFLGGGLGLAFTTCLGGHTSRAHAAPPPAAPVIALVGAELHVGDGAVIKDAVVTVIGETI